MFQPMTLQNTMSARLGPAQTVSPRASRLFDRALATGRRRSWWARLLGGSRQLARLDATDDSITGRHAEGTRTVPLDHISGSVSKADDFDCEFYPLQERTENRWVRVATAMLRGETLPPVELIRVGDRYFVVDGHHRISVARALGHSHIDAVITAWNIG